MLAQIDWTHPWYDSVRPTFERLQLAGDSFIDAFNANARALALANHRGLPLRFVPQSELPEGAAYEEFIGATGCVPTRDNLHDFFNALVWLRFGPIKRRLNELQAGQIAQAGIGPTRGAVRDALTLFDENAALWEPTAAQADALRRRDWHALFVGQRTAWLQRPPIVFGHALLDKLVSPRKAITAHLCVLPQPVTAEWLAAKPFLPLPVLGVPGWWAANESPGFYDDASVFRPAPMRQSPP